MPITYDASVKTASMTAVKTEVGTDGKLPLSDQVVLSMQLREMGFATIVFEVVKDG